MSLEQLTAMHWSYDQWLERFTECHRAIPLLLDLVEREQEGPGGEEEATTASYMSVAQQQLDEVRCSAVSMSEQRR